MSNQLAFGRRSTVGGAKRHSKSDIFKIQDFELANMFKQEIAGDKVANVERVLKDVLSEKNTGIIGDEADLNRRKTLFQRNEKPKPVMPPFKDSLKDALNDRILAITGGLACLSIITGMIYEPKTGWLEGVMILGALFIQVLITAWNDSVKDTRFVKLQSLAQDEELPVIRGKAGSVQTLNIWEMVVGDIVMLQAGDKAPADCLFVDAINIKVDESHLRGEGFTSVEKENGDQLYADSYILEGSAKVVVCAVGENSTRKTVELDTREAVTPLSTKLEKIGGSIRFFGLIAAITVLALSMLMLFINIGQHSEEKSGFQTFLKKFVEFLTIAFIVLIVVIPEGIGMTIGISLAHSVLYMYEKDNILIRDLQAPERLGLVNEICIGKTGTMTTEDMKVVSFYIQNAFHKNDRLNSIHKCSINEQILQLLYESIVFNSSAYIEMNENSFYVPQGQGTEVSLMKWLQDADIAVHQIIQRKEGRVLYTMPFDSSKKYSLIAVQHPTYEDKVRVYVKGAPEVVMEKCTQSIDELGNPMQWESEEAALPGMIQDKMTQYGHRVIAFASKDIDVQDWENELQANNFENDLTFNGVVALHDPLRANIKEQIKEAQKQQINLRLVSGDDINTCIAIARDTGILTDDMFSEENGGIGQHVMTGAQFRAATGELITDVDEDGNKTYTVSNQQGFNQVMDNLKVLARATPLDKLIMIVGLNASQKRVAVVGEGINDVEAFSQASVSFAMGSGVSLARNSASIVLTTNSFESVVRSIMWGRNIYLNMQRFLTFQMTCNLTIVATLVIGLIVMFEPVLNAVQLIWINLIMDILGALALAATRPTTVASREPVNEDRLMQAYNYRSIYGNALWSLIIMMIVIFFGKFMYDSVDDVTGERTHLEYFRYTQTTGDTEDVADKKYHYTNIFNTFVFLQFWSLLNARELDPKVFNPFANLFSNWMLLAVMGVIFAVQLLSTMEGFVFIFENEAIRESEHFVTGIVLGATVLLSNILVKFLPQNIAAKLPVLDETKSVGAENKLMQAYDKQAQAKMIPKKDGGAGQGASGSAADEDGYTKLDA